MTESKSQAAGGIGFLGLLAIVFITLKLLCIIDCSWWWVLAPLWMPVGILLAFIVCVVLVVAISSLFNKDKE